MSCLQEMKGMGNILEKSMENIIESLKRCSPGDFHSNDKLSLQIEASLNGGRAFLLDLIKNGQGRAPALSYRILFLIGLARHSVEDLLLVCSLLQDEKRPDVDLRDEIETMKKLYDKETMAASKEEEYNAGEPVVMQDETEMRICSFGENKISRDINQSTNTWIADDNYFYVLNENRGLFKLSAGSQGKMPGKIEAFNKEFAKE